MNWQEDLVSAGQLKLYCKRAAHDGPAIIALHGWLDTADSFDAFGENLNLYSFDLAGHGQSDHRPPGSNYHIWEYALDMAFAIESLCLNEVHFLGHSLGAAISVMYAALFPDKVKSLFLIEGFAPHLVQEDHTASHMREAFKQRLAPPRFNTEVADLEQAAKRRFENAVSPVTRETARRLVRRQIIATDKGFKWSFDQRLRMGSLVRLSFEQFSSFITEVVCPVHIVMGDKGLFSKKAIAIAESRFKNLTLKQLTGGHHLHMEDAEQQIVDLANKWFHS